MKERAVFLDIISFKDLRKYIDELKAWVLANFAQRDDIFLLMFGKESLEIGASKLLFNLILFQFHIEKGLPINKEDLWLEDYLRAGVLKQHFDKMILLYESKGIDLDETRANIRDIIDELTELSANINQHHGQTLSLLDFIEASKDPDIHDAFYSKVEFGKSFDEIEKQFKSTGARFIDYYRKHPEREIYAMAASDCGMNAQQFTQCAGFVGTKPDINGDIIPYVVTNNYLTGLKEKEDIFISAKGCRKATIFGKSNVKKSGYLTQKLSLLMIDRYNDDELDDCGTEYFVNYVVDTPGKLKAIIGRHYYMLDQNTLQPSSELQTIDGSEKWLIGLTIGLRSPVTCRGKHVCKTCYGRHLAAVNKGLNTGLIATYLLTNPLTQMMLSAKHLLKTDTTPVDWGELKSIMVPNMEKLYIDTTEPFELILHIPDDDQFDEEEDAYFFTKMQIVRNGKAVDYESPEPLYINEAVLDKALNEETGVITINQKFEDEWIFKYFVRNNEMLKSLQEVVDLIEHSDHLGVTTYHGLVNKFIDLCLHNNLGNLMSIHLEMIASALLFKKDSEENLDFNTPDIKDGDYTIERVSSAVMRGPLSAALSFERIQDQLANPKTYQKSKPSLMDNLFL